jgi:hypothetical protein
VATEPTFSNPYVDWASRARDRDALFTHVYFGRRDEFYRLAGRYGVTYVVAEPRAFIAEVDRQSAGFVEKVADYGNMAIYRVR